MPVVRLDPQYDNIRVRRYWALRVPISRPIPLTIFTVIATDTTDDLAFLQKAPTQHFFQRRTDILALFWRHALQDAEIRTTTHNGDEAGASAAALVTPR